MRYRVVWKGPWDGKERPERILTLTAPNKKVAAQLHERLFPALRRQITKVR